MNCSRSGDSASFGGRGQWIRSLPCMFFWITTFLFFSSRGVPACTCLFFFQQRFSSVDGQAGQFSSVSFLFAGWTAWTPIFLADRPDSGFFTLGSSDSTVCSPDFHRDGLVTDVRKNW